MEPLDLFSFFYESVFDEESFESSSWIICKSLASSISASGSGTSLKFLLTRLSLPGPFVIMRAFAASSFEPPLVIVNDLEFISDWVVLTDYLLAPKSGSGSESS